MKKDGMEKIMIVDSGSTKTDWCLVCGGTLLLRCATSGINPFHQSEEEIEGVLAGELVPQLSAAGVSVAEVSGVSFYGAGCRGAGIDLVWRKLSHVFVGAATVEVCSDMMAAARAVCGTGEGIACILGTGANSCLFDGCDIVANVSPLGYVLGDEGSGAVLGKLFLNELFKGDIPSEVRDEFLKSSGETLDDIIRHVYREPQANRWLASLSPFIRSHLDCPQVNSLVVRNFCDFFRKNVDHYGRRDLPVGAVGSVAYYYREQLAAAASSCGYTLGIVVRSPLDALIG